MKRSLFIIAYLLLGLAGTAQMSLQFGYISPEERKMTGCPFDPDADAVVLLHEATTTYSDDWELITDHHIRMKILRAKGIPNADISINYRSRDDFENVLNIEGMVINYDENGERHDLPIERKSVYSKNLNTYWSAKRFAFPSVKAGSIIEYRYRVISKSVHALPDWYFQKELPVMDSKFVLYVHPKAQFNYSVYKSASMPVDVQQDPSNGKVTFEMKNIPGLRDEPYMDSPKDYLQRVNFQLSGFVARNYVNKNYMSSWDALKKELLAESSFGGQLGKNLDGTGEFVKSVSGIASEFEKMKMAYDHVRGNMSWNNINTIWPSAGVKQAWSKKTGTSAEINFILVNVLREIGLDASPMLVSERYNGKVDKSYPFYDQFNTVYACVNIGDKKYFLDATNHTIPAGITPVEILNTTAFIVNRKSGGLIDINDDQTVYKSNANALVKVLADGSIKGEALVSHDGYARFENLAEYKADEKKYVAEHFNEAYAGVSISDFAISNEQVDSLPLNNKFHFEMAAGGDAGYLLLPCNFFSGYAKNPFISDNRFSRINFGWKQVLSTSVSLQFPEEFKVDELPKSIRIVNSDNTISFTRQVYPDDGTHTIAVRTRMEINRSEYPADEYANLKVFYKRLFELMSEQIVLKKK